MAGAPFRAAPDGVVLVVRLTPRGGRDGLGGVVEDGAGHSAAAIRVAAPAVEGAANRALVRYVAAALGLPASAVRIRRGETGRLKHLHLDGETAVLEARLAAWLGL